MITFHHLNNSRSQRVLWLLEEFGLLYEIKRYERDPETMLAPESLRAVHPLGKSPVITDRALTLAESGAIVEYLVDRYGEGRLVPAPGTPERLQYTYWLHYAIVIYSGYRLKHSVVAWLSARADSWQILPCYTFVRLSSAYFLV
jgi:glutathione S-transferase